MRRLHLTRTLAVPLGSWMAGIHTGVLKPDDHHPVECFALDMAGRAQCFGSRFCCDDGSSGSSRVAVDIALRKCEGQASKGRNSSEKRSHLGGYLATKRDCESGRREMDGFW